MLRRIAPLLVRHRRLVVALWAVFLGSAVVVGSSVSERLVTDAEGKHGTDAGLVIDRLEALGQAAPDVVGLIDGRPIADTAAQAAITKSVTQVRQVPGVVTAFSGLDSPLFTATDGNAALIAVRLDPALDEKARDNATDEVVTILRATDAPRVVVGGTELLERETVEQNEKDLKKAELISLPIVLVLAILIFGGFIAASLPLTIGLVAIPGSLLVLRLLSEFTTLHVFALNAATMLGLGLAIDYALLIVNRFREERAAGNDVEASIVNTVNTAGLTVAFSGLTVGVALFGFVMFDNDVFRSIGLGGIGVVLIAMLAAITLLPAILGFIGHRIKPARVDKAAAHGYFHRVATLVQRRAVLVAGLVTVGLIVLAVPFVHARIEIPGAESLPRSLETRVLYDEQQSRFSIGGDNPITVIVEAPPSATAAYVASIGQIANVRGFQVRPVADPNVTVIDIVPDAPAQSGTAEQVVRELRALPSAAPTLVGGPAAMLIDQRTALFDRLPYALVVMGLATFVLLFLLTGSVFVPVKAIVMNLLSLTATFGVLVWGFQDGNLAGALNFDNTGFLALWLPFLVFFLAFGLSMDYEVFLLARIKEEYDLSGDNDAAVSRGLQRTGRIITSAALLIGVVFAAFATGQALDLKAMGVGLTLAIVLDATVVRTLLVPATMKLMGDWNWWAPAPLRRFHQRFGLHEAPSSTIDVRDREPQPEPALR